MKITSIAESNTKTGHIHIFFDSFLTEWSLVCQEALVDPTTNLQRKDKDDTELKGLCVNRKKKPFIFWRAHDEEKDLITWRTNEHPMFLLKTPQQT